MARTARSRSESDIYHVMVRGEGRRILFEDDEDRLTFLRLLSHALSDYGATAYAWCLMPNHVHLLVKSAYDKLPRMMQSLTCGYAVYYNKRYDHVGHVFGGRYESKPVEDDAYLMQLVRYIHLNPVEEGLSETCRYQWSSYSDYLDGTGFVEPAFVLGVFGGLERFRRFHEGLADEKAMQVTGRRSRISDAEALAIAKEKLGEDGLEALASLDKEMRNEGIAELRRVGLSVRQIERFTGIGRGIVSRVEWK